MAEVIDLGDQQVPVEPIPSSMYAAGGSVASPDGRRIATSNDRVDAQRLARSENGRTAAALAAGNLVMSFVDHPVGGAQTMENAERVMGELRESLDGSEIGEAILPAAPASPVSRTESGLVVVQEPQQPTEIPTDYELPPEYAFLNETDEPADDEDDELEPAAAPAEPEPDALELDEDDLLDPRIKALAEENARLQKKARHEQQLRVKTTRPTWEQEASRVFRLGDVPLLDADDFATIKADSKREFLRQAKVIADRNKRAVLRFAPAQRSESDIRREVKAEVWGAPPAGTPPSDVQTNDYEARLARARRTGKLANSLKEMIRGE